MIFAHDPQVEREISRTRTALLYLPAEAVWELLRTGTGAFSSWEPHQSLLIFRAAYTLIKLDGFHQ